MADIRKSKVYKTMTAYNACAIAEGFADSEPTERELHAAWQWLVDTGTCWHLQGWYGRNAAAMIEAGTLEPALKSHKDYYGHTVRGTAE